MSFTSSYARSLLGDLSRALTGERPRPRALEAHPVLLDGGREAFREIIRCIDEAQASVEVRAFLWRDDEIGNEVGRAILRAAERGVKIDILKDRIAAVYEYTAGTRQSFFHKRITPTQRFQAWFLGTVYGNKGSRRQRRNPVAEAILEHHNVTVRHHRKRFDHSKLFIFDSQRLIIGSMGIGDAHHEEWVEMAVRLDGAQYVARLRERLDDTAPFESERPLDFLTHSRETHPTRTCPMLRHRIQLIDSAQKSLVIAMAYLGDRRFTNALIRAVRRGVDVTLVTASRSDVLGDLGRGTCDMILRRTRAPQNLAIVFLPRMVHAKVVVRDGRYADIGSANFTPLSHGVYDEINLHVDDPEFARSVEDAIEALCNEEGEIADSRVGFRRIVFHIERAIVAYQGRRGG